VTLQTFTLGTFAQQGVAAGDFDSIATTTVGSGGAADITFSSIPSTYTHLQIRGILKDGGAQIVVNADTGANYRRHVLYGDGSSAGAATATNFSIATYSTSANIFAGNIIEILDYANTNKYKTFRVLAGFDANGSGEAILHSGLWLSTSAITSIKFQGATIAQYSQLALYGIKA
jgi:hypothetical protein